MITFFKNRNYIFLISATLKNRDTQCRKTDIISLIMFFFFPLYFILNENKFVLSETMEVLNNV